MEELTDTETSRDGRKRTKEANKLMHDAKNNVGAPASQHRKRMSPNQYTGYMDLMRKSVEFESSSFEEEMQHTIWVDAMVEEYESIVRNSVWDVVSRPVDKSMVSSQWFYKVK